MPISDLTRPYEILLVEDNPADQRLVQEALSETRVEHNLWMVSDGDQCLQFLRHDTTEYKESPRPDLILLDLNMRQKDGREVLAEIKSDHHLRSIPVVVFTSSTHERDIFNAYHNYANTYIIKPRHLSDCIRAMESITDYWFNTATHLLR